MGQSSSSLTPEMAAAIKTKVDDIIANNGVVVFSKSRCPYCKTAKAILVKHGVKAFILELDQIDDGAAIQDYLLQLTQQRTVPNIFIGQVHKGGCDNLVALDESGELTKLLAKL